MNRLRNKDVVKVKRSLNLIENILTCEKYDRTRNAFAREHGRSLVDGNDDAIKEKNFNLKEIILLLTPSEDTSATRQTTFYTNTLNCSALLRNVLIKGKNSICEIKERHGGMFLFRSTLIPMEYFRRILSFLSTLGRRAMVSILK